MSANTEQRKLAAIMFTDMVGYSALSQRNEALALELLEEHRRVVRGLLPRHGGREVKTTGDGFLLEFPSALAAVQGAVEIQNALHERNQVSPPERQLRIRIGIHVGDVVMKDGDIHGDGVNIAARIEPLAAAGGICISSAVQEQVRNKLAQPLAALGPAELKNIELPVVVHRVVMPWETTGSSRGNEAQTSKSAIGNRQSAIKKSLVTSTATRWAGIAVLVLLAVGGGWWFVHRSGQETKSTAQPSNNSAAPLATPSAPSATDQKSIAVLPFVNMSADKDNEYLSDGITEGILDALAHVPGLHVPARTSSFVFKGKTEDIQRIGELLHVGTVLEGSVQKAGNQLRVTAQLINVADGFHLWSERYDRDMTNIFAIQDDIARIIVAKLKVTLAGSAELSSARHRGVSVEAYELYLKGRFHADKLTEAELNQAITHFQAALTRQPDYALAYAGLAQVYGLLRFYSYVSPEKVTPQFRVAVAKALALDDTLAEAHVSLARLRFQVDWDWVGAEREFRRAVELDPANAYAHGTYAYFLGAMGRRPEALVEVKKAQQLDPLSAVTKVNVGYVFAWAGDYDRAVEAGRQAIAMEPGFFRGHQQTADALFRKGQREAAIVELEKANQLSPSLQVLGSLGLYYGRVGRRADAQKVLDQLLALAKQQYVPAMSIAQAYIALEDLEQCNIWMNKAIADRESALVYLKVLAGDIPRANPHYPEWLKKIGLEP